MATTDWLYCAIDVGVFGMGLEHTLKPINTWTVREAGVCDDRTRVGVANAWYCTECKQIYPTRTKADKQPCKGNQDD